MQTIKKIIIACYKGDFYLTRICVASIRYFYPNIDILLIKDLSAGNFSTKELEKNWNVKCLSFPITKFGWGLSKLEPLFLNTNERVLILDSDTVFIGNVLDKLNQIEADIIVSAEFVSDLSKNWVKKIYYDIDRVIKYDKDFIYPGFLFNTGNYIVRTNIFKRLDFKNLVIWDENPYLIHPEIFSCADQGILNYVVAKKLKNKKITVATQNFMLWGVEHILNNIKLNDIIKRSKNLPFLIHWAGTRHYLISRMCRFDILNFFENNYYSRVSFGKLKKNLRYIIRYSNWSLKIFFFGIFTSIQKIIRS